MESAESSETKIYISEGGRTGEGRRWCDNEPLNRQAILGSPRQSSAVLGSPRQSSAVLGSPHQSAGKRAKAMRQLLPCVHCASSDLSKRRAISSEPKALGIGDKQLSACRMQHAVDGQSSSRTREALDYMHLGTQRDGEGTKRETGRQGQSRTIERAWMGACVDGCVRAWGACARSVKDCQRKTHRPPRQRRSQDLSPTPLRPTPAPRNTTNTSLQTAPQMPLVIEDRP